MKRSRRCAPLPGQLRHVIRPLSRIPAVLVVLSSDCAAGMPGVLPEDVRMVLRLNQEPHQRLQAISFFIAGIVLSSVAFQQIWNYLQRDFVRLPRLSLPRAMAFVLLLGSMFVVVLTMISGARELMTPGAWKKDGLTYSLRAASDSTSAENAAIGPEGRP